MNISKGLTRQRGFSAGCVLIGLVFFSLAGFLGLRLGSPYIEYRILSGAVDEVVNHEDIGTLTSGRVLGRIKESVRRSSGINPSKLNLDEIVYIAASDGRKVVGVNYEVAVKLLFNVSALLHFQHESTAKPNG